MHPQSRDADEYRLDLIKKWIEDAGVDFDVYDLIENPVLHPYFRIMVAAASDRIESQRFAMVDPGEEIDA